MEWTKTDAHVTADGLERALGYLYGRKPILDEEVLAAATYLELEELGKSCVAQICLNMGWDTFLDTLQFATLWKGGERAAELEAFCWKYLSRTAFREMRPLLSQLSLSQLERLFTADELWVPTEADRFRLIFEVLEPKLVEARENLSEVVVGDVLNNVLEQVSDTTTVVKKMEDEIHGGRGLKRGGGVSANGRILNENGLKKQCYVEMGHPHVENNSSCPEDLIGVEQGQAQQAVFCDEQVPASQCVSQQHGFATRNTPHAEIGQDLLYALSDEVSTDSVVLNGAVASASDILNILNKVLSGDEGLLYGSIGFGSLLTVRGESHSILVHSILIFGGGSFLVLVSCYLKQGGIRWFTLSRKLLLFIDYPFGIL